MSTESFHLSAIKVPKLPILLPCIPHLASPQLSLDAIVHDLHSYLPI